MQSLWSLFLYLFGLLVDAFSLCEMPAKLHASKLDRDQYFGTWFFTAAASSFPSSLEPFTTTDSIMFRMTQSDSPERLQLRAAIRLKTGQCVPRSWIYLLTEQSADLATEGRPYMRTELFTTKCPDCIMVKETDQGYQRILLYSRTLHPAENCITAFKSQASCLDMDEFLLIPRTHSACKFQES
ncbi:apolipoprotein M [Heteronotia binoei]|uniref:apolipoprotein M n=1 Tax=Heteronotia binoei TaxID=13085 RepID=UPI0029317E25|nr:apolipoprotein M [Heteronotia binoei]XP_060095075.1 apolipoprotein M [Heteronotia binoei]